MGHTDPKVLTHFFCFNPHCPFKVFRPRADQVPLPNTSGRVRGCNNNNNNNLSVPLPNILGVIEGFCFSSDDDDDDDDDEEWDPKSDGWKKTV